MRISKKGWWQHSKTRGVWERATRFWCTCDHSEKMLVLNTLIELSEVEGPFTDAQRHELYMAAEHLNDATCYKHF